MDLLRRTFPQNPQSALMTIKDGRFVQYSVVLLHYRGQICTGGLTAVIFICLGPILEIVPPPSPGREGEGPILPLPTSGASPRTQTEPKFGGHITKMFLTLGGVHRYIHVHPPHPHTPPQAPSHFTVPKNCTYFHALHAPPQSHKNVTPTKRHAQLQMAGTFVCVEIKRRKLDQKKCLHLLFKMGPCCFFSLPKRKGRFCLCLFELWGCACGLCLAANFFTGRCEVRAVFWCTCWMRRVQSFSYVRVLQKMVSCVRCVRGSRWYPKASFLGISCGTVLTQVFLSEAPSLFDLWEEGRGRKGIALENQPLLKLVPLECVCRCTLPMLMELNATCVGCRFFSTRFD